MNTLKRILVIAAALAALVFGVYGVVFIEEVPFVWSAYGLGGILLLSLLWWAYRCEWVDWIHLPLTIAWAAIALGGEKYIAGAYSLTRWEVGDAFLFGMLALALALFVPIHLWDLSFPHLVKSAQRRILAAYGATIAILLVQVFLRFGAETWIRNTPDAWGWLVSLAAICAGLVGLGYALWRIQERTHWVPFLPSPTPHR